MDKEKIKAHFGADFYEKMLICIEKYTGLWGLSDLEQIDYYSVNCLFKCVSDKYGKCILKIKNPSQETDTEYNTLKEYNGKMFCKVYEADIVNGVILIERITPGTQLRAEPDFDKRLDLFCRLWSGLHIKAIDKTIYPTYLQWVIRITKYMREITAYEKLYQKMLNAEQVCLSLCEKYQGEMLLHGDLHHDNILLDKNNHYRIIDPKGVIGDVVFDIPRFILNEFDDIVDTYFYDKYTHITRFLSGKLNIPEYDIRCLVYVEMCMANCWCVENKEKPNMDEVLFTEKLMNEML